MSMPYRISAAYPKLKYRPKASKQRGAKSVYAKRVKTSKASTMRIWGIPEALVKMGTGWLRYTNPVEKGIYWWHFSRKIRTRDVEKWGTCISCAREITLDTSDCGHFIPASNCGRDLLFDERNNNAECSRCNAWDEGHLFGYEKGLDTRYGPGTATSLKVRYEEIKEARKRGEVQKEWKYTEYEIKLRELGITPTVDKYETSIKAVIE